MHKDATKVQCSKQTHTHAPDVMFTHVCCLSPFIRHSLWQICVRKICKFAFFSPQQIVSLFYLLFCSSSYSCKRLVNIRERKEPRVGKVKGYRGGRSQWWKVIMYVCSSTVFRDSFEALILNIYCKLLQYNASFKWISHQKATKALFVIEYESKLHVLAFLCTFKINCSFIFGQASAGALLH